MNQPNSNPPSGGVPPVQTTNAAAPLPENSDRFSDEKKHYESLTSLFKYSITIVTTVLGIIAAVVGYVTYTNGKELKEELKEQKKELTANVKEMRDDLLRQKDDLKEKEEKLQGELVELKKQTAIDVQKAREEALLEIQNISSIAGTAAKERVNQVFRENDFDAFVVKVAKDRMEPQIKKLVDDAFAGVENQKRDRIKVLFQIKKSSDNITRQEAFRQMEITNDGDLKPQDIDTLIAFVKEPSVDFWVKDYVINFLSRKDIPVVYRFFRDYMSEKLNDPVLYHYLVSPAITYLLSSRYSTPLSYYEELVLRCNDPHLFKVIAFAGKEDNPSIVVGLLKSVNVVDHVYNKVGEKDIALYKINLENGIGNAIKKEVYSNTYFFTRGIKQ